MPVADCNCADCRAEREAFACSMCGESHPSEHAARMCCPQFECPECGYAYHYEEDAANCCAEEDYDEEYGSGGSDYGTLPELGTVYRLDIPTLPNRPQRACSIEQEVGSGGSKAAAMLGDYGYATSGGIRSYSADCDPGWVIVKEDGSLPSDGGEIVYSRFNLNQAADAERLSEALARVRLLRECGHVRSSSSAGTHVHISATASDGTRILPQHMAALHEVFVHLEDTLYALAACGWDSHRLDEGYDGNTYCKGLPKVQGKTTPAKVLREMRRDRYLGLNFARLIEAVQTCRCGAGNVGAWDECECGAMDSATVEWRLFNSSTKPETIHAWLLVAHALTAYAAEHELGTLTPTEIRSGTPESRWEQLEWMLATCPFTDDEREVVRDAAKRSPGFGYVADTY